MARLLLLLSATLVAIAGACRAAVQRPPTGATAAQAGASPAVRANADSGTPPYTVADVRFMTGMIDHHAQAVLIGGWAPSHGASGPVRILCERIVVAQRDEIAFMQRWLGERHQNAPPPAEPQVGMPGVHHPTLMPGMLTAAQLAQLDSARGPEFDRLFLTYMIQHHQGAITMVEQLLRVPGAAQDGQVFRFVADVNADQTTEIDRMTRMLDAMPPSEAGP